jgi:hypothetical protein
MEEHDVTRRTPGEADGETQQLLKEKNGSQYQSENEKEGFDCEKRSCHDLDIQDPEENFSWMPEVSFKQRKLRLRHFALIVSYLCLTLFTLLLYVRTQYPDTFKALYVDLCIPLYLS